jgi:hypothetical protein
MTSSNNSGWTPRKGSACEEGSGGGLPGGKHEKRPEEGDMDRVAYTMDGGTSSACPGAQVGKTLQLASRFQPRIATLSTRNIHGP